MVTFVDLPAPLIALTSVFLSRQDEEEAGLLELLKSQICDNAALYAQKYDEEFQPYLPRFVTAIWNLLVSTGQEVKYDLVRKPSLDSRVLVPSARVKNPPVLWLQLVSNAIQFLASVCERTHYKHLFEDQNTLTSICEKVIVPNMEFRSESLALLLSRVVLSCRDADAICAGADEEAFEDNSEEYIRRDLEGSGKEPPMGVLSWKLPPSDIGHHFPSPPQTSTPVGGQRATW